MASTSEVNRLRVQGLKKLFHYEWRPSIVWRRITKSLGSRQFALFQAAVVHPLTLPVAAHLRQRRLHHASKEAVARNCGKLWEGTVGTYHANVHAWLEHTKSNSSVILLAPVAAFRLALLWRSCVASAPLDANRMHQVHQENQWTTTKRRGPA